VDNGPIIAQAAVPVASDDNEERLAERVLAEEHRVYPQVIRWICQGRVALGPDGRVRMVDGRVARGSLVSPPADPPAKD
jgi:phosphoribosylglycinamide formyltransferase-1